jgi:NAD+ kinase
MNISKVLVFAHLDHPSLTPYLRLLEAWRQTHHIQLQMSRLSEPLPPSDPDLIVAIGGDGTFLKAARYAAPKKIPLMGFHIGGLGFLPQSLIGDLPTALEAILAGRAQIEERLRLAGEFIEGETKELRVFTALNEVVVSHSRPDRFTDLELWCDDQLVGSYPGDGLIVSTPTGSTAYSLSAGGPVAQPTLSLFIVTPLASHQLAIRPLILDASRRIKIIARFSAQVMVDGESLGSLQPGGIVSVQKSNCPTRIIILDNHSSFFDRLANKLNWAQISYRKIRPPSS